MLYFKFLFILFFFSIILPMPIFYNIIVSDLNIVVKFLSIISIFFTIFDSSLEILESYYNGKYKSNK